MAWRGRATLALLLLPASLPAQDAGAPLSEIFVDASAPAAGDGTRTRPFQTVRAALGVGAARIHLSPGVYSGDVLLEGVELLGGPGVVVSATAPATCLRTRGAVRLQAVQVQGGAAGLQVESGRAELDGVRFSGQRGVALEVAEAAELLLSGSTVQATVSGQPGVRILPGARATLRDVAVEGPFRRGVEAARPASLRLERVKIRDAVSGLHLEGGETWASNLEVRGGRGPGIYVSRGKLHLAATTVIGHEYGMLTGEKAEVDGDGLRAFAAERAGVAVVRSRATLGHVTVEDAGSFGGVQIVDANVVLTDVTVTGGRSSGIVSRGGRLDVQRARLSALKSTDPAAGDGVQVRGGQATLSEIHVEGCSGIGVLAAESAVVRLTGSSIHGAGVAGLSAETGAHLIARDVVVEQTHGPAALVLSGAKAELRGIRARSNRDGTVWAECSQQVEVFVDGWSGDAPPPRSVCVQLGPP
jgi:hypothetical protein